MRRSLYGSTPCIVFTWLGMRARCTALVPLSGVRPRTAERERERALLLLVSVELDMLGDLVCKTVLNQWFSWRVPLKPYKGGAQVA